VKDSNGNLVQGRTRWRRFAAVIIPGAVAAGALMAGVAQGAVPVAMNVSGQSFKISADSLNGTGFTQYGSVAVTKGGSQIPVAASGIKSADIVNLCQSVVVVPGHLSLVIRAGREGSDPVHADNLLIGMNALAGDAKVFASLAQNAKAFQALTANSASLQNSRLAVQAMSQNQAAFAKLGQDGRALANASLAAQAFNQASAAASLSSQGKLNANVMAAMQNNPQAFALISSNPKAFEALSNNPAALASFAKNANAFAKLGQNPAMLALSSNPSFAAALQNGSLAKAVAVQSNLRQ